MEITISGLCKWIPLWHESYYLWSVWVNSIMAWKSLSLVCMSEIHYGECLCHWWKMNVTITLLFRWMSLSLWMDECHYHLMKDVWMGWLLVKVHWPLDCEGHSPCHYCNSLLWGDGDRGVHPGLSFHLLQDSPGPGHLVNYPPLLLSAGHEESSDSLQVSLRSV